MVQRTSDGEYDDATYVRDDVTYVRDDVTYSKVQRRSDGERIQGRARSSWTKLSHCFHS